MSSAKAEAVAAAGWSDVNQQALVHALARVRRLLEGGPRDQPASIHAAPADDESAPALDRLCQLFGLSRFERDTLLLCAGVELDSAFAQRCGEAQGDSSRAWPTFSLALAILPDAHWSALAPAAPLRRWRLIEIGSGSALTQSQIRIDERILHYLAGVQYTDERLSSFVEEMDELADPLPPSQQLVADRVAAAWGGSADADVPPVVQLLGNPSAGRAVALEVCRGLGLDVRLISAEQLPTSAEDLDILVRLWRREMALVGCALLLDCDDVDPADRQRSAAVRRFSERLHGPLLLLDRERRRDLPQRSVAFDVGQPSRAEQRAIWERHAGHLSLNGALDALAAQFDVPAGAIRSIVARTETLAVAHPEAVRMDGAQPDAPGGTSDALWDAARQLTRPRLEALARRIAPVATWQDIVLPEAQLRILREVAIHVRHRSTVYERWGFAARHARGLGIAALFAGPSGTGKTMAAEVLANELRLDLYHIDLSQVVSKYIGETEKNLRQLFDAAEGGGAILLFDEADALFGKRSEVKDSHDRYSNIEVSYLLQRMESYRGLAILTTNMKDALDAAFLRRIRFVVQFTFPALRERTEIWRRVFPSATPTVGLQPDRLAHLNVAGGSIRNIAMNAAFLAASEGGPVRMGHLATAARGEFLKLEKPFNDAELGSRA